MEREQKALVLDLSVVLYLKRIVIMKAVIKMKTMTTLIIKQYNTGLADSGVRSHGHTPTRAICCLAVRSSHA